MKVMSDMNGRTHNKRRNAGLLYEFLVHTISSALVEGDQKRSAAALKLLKKHFKPGSELYKEFRLINALVTSTVSSPSVASSIIGEAKLASRQCNVDALDKEKSVLLKRINHTLNESGNFFDQHINDYTMYATAQTLLNSWRGATVDLAELAVYEDKLTQWLTESKQRSDVSVSTETPGSTRLLMKVMTQKLNEKYGGSLSADQKSLVKAYVFSTGHDDSTIIKKRLEEVRVALVASIDGYVSHHADETYTCNKLEEVRQCINSESLHEVDDATVTRFMQYVKLNSELGEE